MCTRIDVSSFLPERKLNVIFLFVSAVIDNTGEAIHTAYNQHAMLQQNYNYLDRFVLFCI